MSESGGGEGKLRAMITKAREKASEIQSAQHVSAEVKGLLTEFDMIGELAMSLLSDSGAASVDTRMLKRKMENLRMEKWDIEKKLEAIKAKVLPLIIAEIKVITQEASKVSEKFKDTNGPELKSLTTIRAAAVKIIEAFK